MGIKYVIKLRNSLHHDKPVVQLIFEKNEDIIKLLRKGTPIRWSKTMNCWYVSYYKNILQDLFALVKDNYYLDYSDFNDKKINDNVVEIKSKTIEKNGNIYSLTIDIKNFKQERSPIKQEIEHDKRWYTIEIFSNTDFKKTIEIETVKNDIIKRKKDLEEAIINAEYLCYLHAKGNEEEKEEEDLLKVLGFELKVS